MNIADGRTPRVVIQHAAKSTTSRDEIIPKLRYAVDDLRDDLSADEYLDLQSRSSGGRVFMRGVDPGSDGKNVDKWNEIKEGDIALIAWHSSVRAAGEVIMRKQSAKLAALGGAPAFEYLYFLRHLEPVEIPYADLNRVLLTRSGRPFAKANNFERFSVMTEQQSASVIDLLRAFWPHLPRSGGPTRSS